MSSILQSLHIRLVAVILVVFGLIQLGLFTLTLAVSERLLRTDLDRRLTDETLRMAKIGTAVPAKSAVATSAEEFHFGISPSLLEECYVQVKREDGTVLERSGNLKDMKLPLNSEARQSATLGRPVLETLPGANSPSNRSGELRLATVYQKRLDAEPCFLQIAVRLAPVTNAIATLRRTFWTLIPLGLVAAGAAAWWLVRRSLAPIGEIARKTRDLTAESLEGRIEIAPGRDEVTEMVVNVNQMLARLETTFKAQNRFIADAAHELKTPVTLLLGQAQVLSQKARTMEEYDQFVGSVEDETRHLAQIVESLLMLARAEAGSPSNQFVSISVNEVIMDAVQRSTSYARQRESRLVPILALPDSNGPDPHLEGAPELLCAMLTNLLHNALLYSPPDTAVEIEVSLRDHDAVLAVRDRGPGIPPEDLERVFERFYRVPRPGETFRGTGLGLALARAVARLHRGEITARARPGGGSEFVIHLPLTGSRQGPQD